MTTTSVVLLTLVSYKLLLIGIGLWAQRRVHDEADFFLGGKGLGPVVAAFSYSASSSSAWTLLGLSGVAFSAGLSAIWLALGSFIGMLVAWYWIAPRLQAYAQQHAVLTLTDVLSHTLAGPWRHRVVVLASFIVLVSFAFYVAAQFQGAGTTFANTFDMPFAQAVTLGALIVMIYTFLGGFWAVSVTDTLQGALMAGTAIALPLFAWLELSQSGGLLANLAATSTQHQLSLTAGNSGWLALGFVLGTLCIGFGTFGQPHLLVRFMALRDQRALAQARLLTIFWFAVVFGGMVFVGLAGQVLLPQHQHAESVFFALTAHLFNPFVGAVIIAAVLSAIMSTADSQLLVAASVVVHDLRVGQRWGLSQVSLSRLTIALLVVVSVLVALYLPATIFNRALFAWTALGAAFGPPLLMLLARVKLSGAGLFYGMLLGFGLAVLCYLAPDTTGDIVERVLPFCCALLVLWLTRVRQPAIGK